MQSTAKAAALSRDLADKFRVRFPAAAAGLNTVREASDSAGWPMIFLSHNGSEAAGQPVIAIRIKNVDMVSKDIFGNQTFAYAPHTLECAYELTATANCPTPTLADLAKAKWEAERAGARFQEKSLANTTAVTAANMDAASAIADLEDLYWPTKSV